VAAVWDGDVPTPLAVGVFVFSVFGVRRAHYRPSSLSRWENRIHSGSRPILSRASESVSPRDPGSMRHAACLSWRLLVCWYPAGWPHSGTLAVVWLEPARVFGSHV
jgi:hypothetical protein